AQRLLPVGRLDNGVSVLLEREGEHLPDGVLVVDEEDRGGRIGHRSPGAARIALGMSTARTPKARRRARRGSLERPVNARLYRSAFLLLSLPLLVLAFSVTRPTTLPAPLLPPNFDGRAARALASELATEDPDRSPGGTGQVRASVRLHNLWAVAGGQSFVLIVVVAHRDDTGEGPGANDDASGTAALVELARGYAQPDTPAAQRVRAAHTIVFLSTDAGSFGGLGAKRFAERSPFHVVATINLAAIGGPGPPRIVIAGDTPRSPAASLVVTAAKRVLEQTGSRPRRTAFLSQLVDLAFPFTLYEQGPFVARGIPAVTLTTAGERPPEAFTDRASALDAARLGAMGRATQELIGSLDQGIELAQGTTSFVWVGDRILRGWAVELVLFALLLPFLVVVVDLFAHCRRRRIPLLPA